jgi:hypothetical protein
VSDPVRAITDLAANPSATLAELEAVLNRHPSLGPKLVKVANSPALAGSLPMNDVGRVFSRLDVKGVRDAVFAEHLKTHLYHCLHYKTAMRSMALHAIATGRLARGICTLAELDGDLAFLGGLLHDCGRVALLKLFADVCGNEIRPPESQVVGQGALRSPRLCRGQDRSTTRQSCKPLRFRRSLTSFERISRCRETPDQGASRYAAAPG